MAGRHSSLSFFLLQIPCQLPTTSDTTQSVVRREHAFADAGYKVRVLIRNGDLVTVLMSDVNPGQHVYGLCGLIATGAHPVVSQNLTEGEPNKACL